jgi:polar amino acid transport system substrate-binding protein
MLSRHSRVAGVTVAATLLFAACTGAATPTPGTTAQTVEPAASAPPSAAPEVTTTPAASPAPTVATVPSDQLTFAGKLVICSDIPYPPQEFFDDQGNPTGSDIDIGIEIGKRLGLTGQIENSVFDTIIAAVTGGKCDIIISAQNINADRLKQVDMIPYFQAGQSFVVAKGNPKGIKTQDDLCGKSIGAESGTTESDYIKGTGDYTGQGLSKACTDKSKPAITLKEYQKDSDALLALQSGAVDAYFADSPVAGYYTVQHPDQFELSGLVLAVAKEGISVPKDKTALRDGVKAALLSMINDGTYLTILKKYGDDSGAIPASDIK